MLNRSHVGVRLNIVALALCAGAAEPAVSLYFDARAPQTAFAAAEIRQAAKDRQLGVVEKPLSSYPTDRAAGIRIALFPSLQATPARTLPGIHPVRQGYSIRREGSAAATNLLVIGHDAVGAMYGGLEVAEAIRLGRLTTLADGDHRPYIERRGIKFNLPLDLRTPSYSDCSDAAQQNIPEMWNREFWREFLNEMARHRFNVLTLWSLHPFPSLVKVPEYPDVALDDVWRTRVKLDDTFSFSGSDMVRPAMLKDVEVVKKLTMGEKIQFWRQVMQDAQDRGIEVYLFTWNTFTFGTEGKYGITPALTNRTTIAYFRASVRETVLTYPLLKGIGITAGEQMPNRQDEFAREKWLWQAYGEGIRDALKIQPGREFRLIHRFHMTGLNDILDAWKDYPGPLDLSFKYSIAHMYSITNPPYIKGVLPHLTPEHRTWLTVRNDDIYSFRWGDPDYARDYIRAMPGPDKIMGFYMGPDGYTWGREFLSTEPDSPRQLVLQKQWYSFLLWGRLSYEPTLPNDHFQRLVAARFPEAPADQLFQTWAEASRVFPQITRFFWGDIDLRWLPEACLSHPRHKGFYTVRHFIEGVTMPGSGCVDILSWRARQLAGQPVEGVTPLAVADNLARHASNTLAGLRDLARTPQMSKELRLTLGDLEAMAHLGNYYAEKIRGAASLALFDVTSAAGDQAAAVRHLESALEHWRRYAAVYGRQYRPALYNRVGFVDIPALTAKVQQDIALAKTWQPGTIQDSRAKRPGEDVPFRP